MQMISDQLIIINFIITKTKFLITMTVFLRIRDVIILKKTNTKLRFFIKNFIT